MSTFTENYNLIKPDEADYYDVQDFNENMDIIDNQISSLEQDMEEISEKIGENTDETDETVFGHLNKIEEKLNGNQGIVKSVQRIIYRIPSTGSSYTAAINPVDINKTFVISERLENGLNYLVTFSYTLTESGLQITHLDHSNFDSGCTLGFWIIEFY